MTPKSTAPSTHESKVQTPSELSSVARADEYFRYSEFAGAVQLYKQALKENPKLKSKLTDQIVKCYYNLGLMKLREKDCNFATDYFRQVLFINEKDLLSKEALEISRTCQSRGFDSVSKSVVFLELRK